MERFGTALSVDRKHCGGIVSYDLELTLANVLEKWHPSLLYSSKVQYVDTVITPFMTREPKPKDLPSTLPDIQRGVLTIMMLGRNDINYIFLLTLLWSLILQSTDSESLFLNSSLHTARPIETFSLTCSITKLQESMFSSTDRHFVRHPSNKIKLPWCLKAVSWEKWPCRLWVKTSPCEFESVGWGQSRFLVADRSPSNWKRLYSSL